MSPCVISNLVSIRSCSAYSLRLHHSVVLECPKGHMLATLGARSFSAATPTLWNSLPMHIHDIESLGAFKRLVKTYLFRLSFTKFFMYFYRHFSFLSLLPIID